MLVSMLENGHDADALYGLYGYESVGLQVSTLMLMLGVVRRLNKIFYHYRLNSDYFNICLEQNAFLKHSLPYIMKHFTF